MPARTRENLYRFQRLAAALAACTMSMIALAQPDEPPRPSAGRPERREPEGDVPIVLDPRALRARLSERLADVEDLAEGLRKAIEVLDAGGSPREALSGMGGFGALDRLGARAPREGPARPPRGTPDEGDEREQARAALDFLAQHAPESAARLRQSIESGEPRARVMIQRIASRVREIREAERSDPTLARILSAELTNMIDVLRATSELRDAQDDDARARAKESLTGALGAQFDLRLQRRRHEIETLAKRLETLRAEVARYEENREHGVNELVERALRGWDRERPDRDAPPEDTPPPENERDREPPRRDRQDRDDDRRDDR